MLLARLRMPLLGVAAILLVCSFAGLLSVWVSFAAAVVAMAVYLRIGTVRREPVTVSPPVLGRWVPVNSPANRVPSHGLHAYGQTYAIDLVYEPPDQSRPGFASRPLTRPPTDFPAFGQPVRAVANGVVVRVRHNKRDHRSRTSWLSMLFLIVEGMLRELTGPGHILGNYVVVRIDDGVYAVFAHLQRGSAVVREGQEVRTGDRLASCGNSGNSSEPHLHFQLMDHPKVLLAAGLPFRFDDYDIGGRRHCGVPANSEPFTAA